MDESTLKILDALIRSLVPPLFLIIGGQFLLDRYAIRRKKKEAEIELIKKTREEKYLIIHELYALFAEFMRLYRKINSPYTSLQNQESQASLFEEIIKAESHVDAIILKIGCEFTDETDDSGELDQILGRLRQSVQLWRETIVRGEKLPFFSSQEKNYLKFKIAFSQVSAFMINKIHGQLEPPNVQMERVSETLLSAFDNKHEYDS